MRIRIRTIKNGSGRQKSTDNADPKKLRGKCFTFEYGGVPGGRGREIEHVVVEQYLTFEYGGVPGGRGLEVAHLLV
jgi:hypothetical protein